jgi:hypothetical protein
VRLLNEQHDFAKYAAICENLNVKSHGIKPLTFAVNVLE